MLEGQPGFHPKKAPVIKPIAVGVGFDGVLVEKPSKFDVPRRVLKTGLQAVDGVRQGLRILSNRHDVDTLGVYTKRPHWREGQTIGQIQRLDLRVAKVTHTSSGPMEKIRTLLDDADGAGYRENGNRDAVSKRRQIVLIDYGIDKVVEAAIKLKETSPEHEEALSRFTLLAFNPDQRHSVQGTIVPGVIHVVSMNGWADIYRVVEVIRRRATNATIL